MFEVFGCFRDVSEVPGLVSFSGSSEDHFALVKVKFGWVWARFWTFSCPWSAEPARTNAKLAKSKCFGSGGSKSWFLLYFQVLNLKFRHLKRGIGKSGNASMLIFFAWHLQASRMRRIDPLYCFASSSDIFSSKCQFSYQHIKNKRVEQVKKKEKKNQQKS